MSTACVQYSAEAATALIAKVCGTVGAMHRTNVPASVTASVVTGVIMRELNVSRDTAQRLVEHIVSAMHEVCVVIEQGEAK